MKTRIMTAIVLIAILLPCVYLGGTIFKILMTVIAIGGVYELLSICDRPKTSLYLYLVVGCFVIYNLYFSSSMIIESASLLVYMVVLFICSMFDEKLNILRLGYYFISTVLLSAGLNAILYMRLNYGFELLLYLALVTFGTDTGAYFIGRFFGKHKLSVRLSPKKTIEGSLGGIVIGGALGIGYGYLVGLDIPLVYLIVISLALTITGQIGDLSFSNMKRTFEVKDFSQLLPGHGGILDRFDAFLFNSVVLSLILYYIMMVI